MPLTARPSLTGIAVTLIGAGLFLGGCTRTSEERISTLERDNRRLTRELSAVEAENRVLELRVEELQNDLQAARSQSGPRHSNAPASGATGGVDPSEFRLPDVDGSSPGAAPAATAGEWVVVLASVGASHAENERPGYQRVADELRARHANELGDRFGLRTPRSGGLQLTYGGNGVTRAQAERALAVLAGRYADAYLLNVR